MSFSRLIVRKRLKIVEASIFRNNINFLPSRVSFEEHNMIVHEDQIPMIKYTLSKAGPKRAK